MTRQFKAAGGVGRRMAWLGILTVWLGGWTFVAWGQPGSTVVFATGFEPPDYEVGFTLADQDGWLSDAIGGNQVFEGYFPGMGQHALIGFSKPEGEALTSVSVWRPVDFDPIAAGLPRVTFSVTMAIVDSEDPALRDSFRWSAWNRATDRLFSVDFDNSDLSIAYLLDDDLGFVVTPFRFERDDPIDPSITLYELVITMDFERNRWSATLNDEVFTEDLPITTRDASLDLGDISAVWVMNANNQEFGDNFMVFDDYRIVATAGAPPAIEVVERRPNGDVLLRLEGDPGRTYVIEGSDDLSAWLPLHTSTVVDSHIEYLDTEAGNFDRRFYQGRLLP
jgi:hypothetical protein